MERMTLGTVNMRSCANIINSYGKNIQQKRIAVRRFAVVLDVDMQMTLAEITQEKIAKER